MAVFLPTVFPAADHRNIPPIPMTDGPGVFNVPGCLEDGSRLLLAYDQGGVIVDAAIVEPGGDFDEAIHCLDDASRSGLPA